MTIQLNKGVTVNYSGNYLCIRDNLQDIETQALLPRVLKLENEAVNQLIALTATCHPDNVDGVVSTYAAPDFHPGDAGIAIGSAVLTDHMVIPDAVGSDINCGMRLHTVDLSASEFPSIRDALVARLKGDYLLGTRDVVFHAEVMKEMFVNGLTGFAKAIAEHGLLGRMSSMNTDMSEDIEKTFINNRLPIGNLEWVPKGLAPDTGVVRDPGLGTIGSGNHFVEIQVVDTIFNQQVAYDMGLKQGYLTYMIHSGSRHVGKHVGGLWKRKVMDAWPKGVKYPANRIFSLVNPTLIAEYLSAQATAANYGAVNRIVLAELVRIAINEIVGNTRTPLVYDLSHNLCVKSDIDDCWITRKGACPAEKDMPVIIPGSMGTASYVAMGKGSAKHLCTASHGAGRAYSRTKMRHEKELGLEGVDCITISEERRIEEAPTAYKNIDTVVNVQVEEGVIELVAKLKPILTFKA